MAQEKSVRSEEHTSELQSPLDISYAVFCLKKGDALFVNKACPEVKFASPVSGQVTAIALGECIYRALGSKRGIERYGYFFQAEDGIRDVER